MKIYQKIGITYIIISVLLVIIGLPLESLGYEVIADIIMYNATACLTVAAIYAGAVLIRTLWVDDIF